MNKKINKKIQLIALTSLFLGLTSLSNISVANNQAAEKPHEHKNEEAEHNKAAPAQKEEHGDDHTDEHQEKSDDGHGHGSEGEEESAGVKLSKGQLSLAEIKSAPLILQTLSYDIYAPGEIKANDYTSYLVSPRVDSVVLKRHVALGDHVEKGQALVTLFSETVASAQASYRVANAEWQRVQKLGRKAVGAQRYVEAQTSFEADYARLSAFGLSTDAIKSLTQSSAKPSLRNVGQYTLYAMTSGAVLSDDFRQGQRLESGDTLIELADEYTLWVEARLAPTMQLAIPVGSIAQVRVGETSYRAEVTQKAHTIDPVTRTRIVRLLVENDDHNLHPGLFADVYFSFATQQQVFAVPEEALMRGSDGDWQVFVEENGEYKGVEVELGRIFSHVNSSQKMREISGISAGTNVVIQGAFYVAAEIAKGGFSAHNH
ncbi:MAG: efflux transporter periplasmic adaptor subunit [Gammaproteobacteria bacterium]|nr:MAG: efflux transporter periplasmic adaptor subunit [Gammaproteobacteria bacterium]